MSQPFDIEARFFDGATGLRLQASPDDILSVSWETVEAGGLSTINVEVARPFDDLNWAVGGGDIVEVWALNTGETAPRARGRVGQFEGVLDLRETKSIIGYGLMEDLNHVIIDRVTVYPGGTDLNYFVGQIADDYAKRRPGLAFVRDIRATGVSLERLEQANATARQGMDQIASQAGGNVVWGWDIDPATGLDRFYLRPKSSAVGHQWFVGDKVKLINAPQEMQGIVNGMKIQGGPAKYPQLLTNPSFENPVNPDEATGSLLLNGGFEDGTAGGDVTPSGNTNVLYWHLSGGATRNRYDPPSDHFASPHTGDWYLTLDTGGEEAYQEVAVTPGTQYTASLFAAQEKGGLTSTGSLIVEGRNGSGTVVESYTLALAPASTAWTGGQGATTLSSDALQLPVTFQAASITTARVRLVRSAGRLLIDDVTFAAAGAVGQTGWSTHLQNPTSGANKFLSLDWASRSAAWEGFYGVRAHVTADESDKPAIAPYPGDSTSGQGYHFKPAPQQDIRVGFRARMSPGLATGSGSVHVEYKGWGADGKQTETHYQQFTVANDGAWHFCYEDVSVSAQTVTATVQATLGASGWYDIDGFTARDTQAGEGADTSDPLGVLTYLRGTSYETYVTAEQVCTPGTPEYDSFADYGRQEAVVSNDQIVDWNADAKQWAIAYFQRNAVPLQRPRVDLTDEWAQTPSPGDGTQVRISALNSDLQDWCARASYTFRQSALSISMDLSNQRPTWAKLLTNLSAGGGGSASSIAAVSRQAAAGGSAGGSGGVGTPSPVPVASSTVSGTVETNTDASGGNPVVYLKSEVDALIAAVSANAPGFPAWGIRGEDMDDGGTVAFDPGGLTPTWQTLWPSVDGNLNFLPTAGGHLQPIAWEQRCVLQTRLKVATSTTITVALYTDNHCRVVLNGTTIGTDADDTNSYPLGTMTYSLSLAAGWNDLQICYGNGNEDTYALVLTGWVSGASVPLASLVDRMSGVLPA